MRFGKRAKDYRKWASVQRNVAEWCSAWIGEDMKGLSAIEFGAGTGAFTEYLAERGFSRLVASDLSRRMVEEGGRAVPAADWRVLDAWQGSDERFDRVYSCNLLQWAREPRAVLEEWRRALTSGGRVLVSVFLEGSLSEFLEGNEAFGAVRFRSSDEWRTAFEEAGFEFVRSERLSLREEFGSALQALRSLHAIGAVEENRWKVGALKRFLRERDEALLRDGKFPLSWEALRLEAVVRER